MNGFNGIRPYRFLKNVNIGQRTASESSLFSYDFQPPEYKVKTNKRVFKECRCRGILRKKEARSYRRTARIFGSFYAASKRKSEKVLF